MNYLLYRKSTLGLCLDEALNSLCEDEVVTEEEAMDIVGLFDRSINKAFVQKDLAPNSTVTLEGKLHTYRYCNGIWTLVMAAATVVDKADITRTVTCDHIKIVSCEYKVPREQ